MCRRLISLILDTIPDAISDNIVLRVLDGANDNVYGDSAVCNINGSITVTQPMGSSNWEWGLRIRRLTGLIPVQSAM